MRELHAASVELSVTEDDDGRCVQLCVGEGLRISLADNRSGGYHWQLAIPDGAPLRLVEQGFDPASAALGSGGRAWWQLQVTGAGATTLLATRKRSWQARQGTGAWRLEVVARAAEA